MYVKASAAIKGWIVLFKQVEQESGTPCAKPMLRTLTVKFQYTKHNFQSKKNKQRKTVELLNKRLFKKTFKTQ